MTETQTEVYAPHLKPSVGSVELFERFLPHFHEITLTAGRFKHLKFPSRENESLEELTERQFDETRVFRIYGNHLHGGRTVGAQTTIHGIELGTLFLNLESGCPVHPFVQVERAIALVIDERMLRGRRFFLHHTWLISEESDKRVYWGHDDSSIHGATITVDGEGIFGLRLPLKQPADWKQFIPEGVEQFAIEKAWEIEEDIERYRALMEDLERPNSGPRGDTRHDGIRKELAREKMADEAQLTIKVGKLQSQLDKLLKEAK